MGRRLQRRRALLLDVGRGVGRSRERAKGDPRVAAWFISDEPRPSCPNVYAQHRQRTDLIHSIDPAAKTVVLVDGNSGRATLDQIPGWKGAADHLALDPYTCWQGKPCQLDWIDK